MYKKIIIGLLSMAFITSPAHAAAGRILSFIQDSSEASVINDTVITLVPESDTVTVNGTEINTEPSYITETGVTLVPLRTISEAFGAEVEWDPDAQTVSIFYSDVTVVLTIGSRAAQVNDHTEELEEPPVISGGSTMIPLRFIAETFGAEVLYDDASQLITIVFSQDSENETLKGMNDKPYIGDSYYEWSMKTPADMMLSSRTFDGSSISFSDGIFSISVDVEKYDEPIDADFEYQSLIGVSTDSIISECEKTDDADGTVHIRMKARSSYTSSAIHAIIDNDTLYIATLYSYSLSADEPDNDKLNEMYSIIDSFTNSINADMYDFSDVVEGMREYTSDELNLTINVPESFQSGYSSSANKLVLSSDTNSLYGLRLELYSSLPDYNLENVPELNREIALRYYNPDISVIGEIEPIEVNGTDGRGYKIELSLDEESAVIKKVYFETGSYIYIATVACASEAECDSIIESIKADELDEQTFGKILQVSRLMDTYTLKSSSYSITLPKYWYSNVFAFENIYTQSQMYIETLSSSDDIEEYIGEIEDDDEITVISPPEWHDTENGRELTAAIMTKDEPVNFYSYLYCIEIDGKYYSITFYFPELYHSDGTLSEFESIKNSLERIE